jgi:hypothetical protein
MCANRGAVCTDRIKNTILSNVEYVTVETYLPRRYLTTAASIRSTIAACSRHVTILSGRLIFASAKRLSLIRECWCQVCLATGS